MRQFLLCHRARLVDISVDTPLKEFSFFSCAFVFQHGSFYSFTFECSSQMCGFLVPSWDNAVVHRHIQNNGYGFWAVSGQRNIYRTLSGWENPSCRIVCLCVTRNISAQLVWISFRSSGYYGDGCYLVQSSGVSQVSHRAISTLSLLPSTVQCGVHGEAPYHHVSLTDQAVERHTDTPLRSFALWRKLNPLF